MHRSQHKFISQGSLLHRTLAVIMITAVVACLFSLPAAAKNTYRITDGDRVLIFSTDATNPVDVLDEAGLALGKDDTYTTQESGDYSEIHVQRVQMVTIDNGGQILKTGTYGETVQQLLNRLDIVVGEDDTLSVALTDNTYADMTISISRRHDATETYAKSIPYTTQVRYDASLPAGEKKLISAGVPGEARVVEEVVYVNNQETSRKKISEEVIREPAPEVIAVSAKNDPTKEPGITISDGVITTETGEVLTYTGVKTMLATAYSCEGWGREGITATGTVARVGAIAVDPTVIPYGTRMFIVSSDGKYTYGVATAEDTGDPDFISGNRIDLYFDTVAECVEFGARDCQVYILG